MLNVLRAIRERPNIANHRLLNARSGSKFCNVIYLLITFY